MKSDQRKVEDGSNTADYMPIQEVSCSPRQKPLEPPYLSALCSPCPRAPSLQTKTWLIRSNRKWKCIQKILINIFLLQYYFFHYYFLQRIKQFCMHPLTPTEITILSSTKIQYALANEARIPPVMTNPSEVNTVLRLPKTLFTKIK